MRVGAELSPVEVELTLTQGLPQISFLGLPDTAIRESTLRIRTALKEQGFTLPQAQQVIVHLRPSYLKKSSRGLDLAVAAALLWETGQIPSPESEETPILYGELTLKGEVIQPDDLDEIDLRGRNPVMTGVGESELLFPSLQYRELRDLGSVDPIYRPASEITWTRPQTPKTIKTFPKKAAEVAAIVAAGEHSALFAGPPGSGKSTLAEVIPVWMDEPKVSEFRIARRLNRQVGRDIAWRPVLRPHHSITPMAMIGGGSALWSGEISRAHGGVLIMDELLEFAPEIQEALREPVESGEISIVRAGSSKTFPARILLLATTNLCGCGRFVPRRYAMKCRCTKNVRRRMLERLSGPFADRFAIFALTDEWQDSDEIVEIGAIEEKITQAIRLRKNRGQEESNARLADETLLESLNEFQRKEIISSLRLSRRRRAAILRVARTVADLDGSIEIRNEDLEKALEYCTEAHRLLEEWQD